MVESFLPNRCYYQQNIQGAREGLPIRQFGSCQGDGLLLLQEWQIPY
ncbi:hypothetical protein LSH36_53g07081 [Paralvinella palmiformis]|uniref:Uncharacterized protein n=1 Tax=Paralvinella palmiformis TaxID=53620 RepID=A0AAD9NCS2_9ANNE|nr:hypothetical protein LSH36_53g07081 [Paralvinella palmiformis]